VIAQDIGARSSQHTSYDKRNDNRVVELTKDGDEVGHEVQWRYEISDQYAEQKLVATSHSRILNQPTEEN
jgi:hypothetical protein